jgi:hypothetical protein
MSETVDKTVRSESPIIREGNDRAVQPARANLGKIGRPCY